MRDRLTRDQINEIMDEMGESLVLMDGMDEALIGISQRPNEPMLAVYSYDSIIDVLMANDGMFYDDAVEYAEFNICCAWIGPETPIIVRSLVY